MFALFHLIFDVIRISILSVIYGFIIVEIISNFKVRKLTLRLIIIPCVFISLLVYRFSYWRNNGFGDEPRVPITSNYEVQMIDFYYGKLIDNSKNDFGYSSIDKLYSENDLLFIKRDKEYALLDLRTEKFIKNLNKSDFINYGGQESKLMNLDEFHSDYFGIIQLLFF